MSRRTSAKDRLPPLAELLRVSAGGVLQALLPDAPSAADQTFHPELLSEAGLESPVAEFCVCRLTAPDKFTIPKLNSASSPVHHPLPCLLLDVASAPVMRSITSRNCIKNPLVDNNDDFSFDKFRASIYLHGKVV